VTGPDLIQRRVAYLLRLCDHDGDDVLEVSDFEEWVDRLAALRGWEPGTDGYTALHTLYVEEAFRGFAAAAGREDGRGCGVLPSGQRRTWPADPRRVLRAAPGVLRRRGSRRAGELVLGTDRGAHPDRRATAAAARVTRLTRPDRDQLSRLWRRP